MKAFLKTIGIVNMIFGLISLAHNVGLRGWVYNNPTVAAIVFIFGAAIYLIVSVFEEDDR